MISNQQVKGICSDWGLSGGSVELGMTREVTLPERLHPDLALIIQGVRRCGKSTLMTQLPKRYGLPLADCYYCNFEDPRLLGALDHTLLTQIVSVARDASSDERHCYFFFDEIQNVQGWEKWLHSQLERPKNNYFTLTGSNAALLSGEFGTSLTGRHRTIALFPFSWPEYQRLFPQKTWKITCWTVVFQEH